MANPITGPKQIYGDRFIPVSVNKENWDSEYLQAAKQSKVRTLGTELAKAIYPNADTRVLTYSKFPVQKAYCAADVKKVKTTIVRTLGAPGLTENFYDNVLTVSNILGASCFGLFLNSENKNEIYKKTLAGNNPLYKWALKNHEAQVTHIQFSRLEGKIFGCQTDQIFTLELAPNKQTDLPIQGAKTMDCSSTDLLAIGTDHSEVVFRDLRQEQATSKLKINTSGSGLIQEQEQVIKCAFSTDQHYFAVGTRNGIFNLFDRRNEYMPIYSYRLNSAVKAIDFDATHVFFGGGRDDGKVRAVNVKGGEVKLDNLITVNLGCQVTTIKVVNTVAGTNLWVAKNGDVELLHFRQSSFYQRGFLPHLKGHRVLNMEIIDDKLLATINDKELFMMAESPDIKEYTGKDEGLDDSFLQDPHKLIR